MGAETRQRAFQRQAVGVELPSAHPGIRMSLLCQGWPRGQPPHPGGEPQLSPQLNSLSATHGLPFTFAKKEDAGETRQPSHLFSLECFISPNGKKTAISETVQTLVSHLSIHIFQQAGIKEYKLSILITIVTASTFNKPTKLWA